MSFKGMLPSSSTSSKPWLTTGEVLTEFRIGQSRLRNWIARNAPGLGRPIRRKCDPEFANRYLHNRADIEQALESSPKREKRAARVSGQPAPETAERMLQGSILIALGATKRQASRSLGLPSETLSGDFSRFKPWGKRLLSSTQSALEKARGLGILAENPPEFRGIPVEILADFREVARLMVTEYLSMTKATRKLDINYHEFYRQTKYYHPHAWERVCKETGVLPNVSDAKPVPLEIRARMQKAALIYVSGHSRNEASRRLGLTANMVSHYAGKMRSKRHGVAKREGFPDFWRRAVEWARQQLLVPENRYQVAVLNEGSEDQRIDRGRKERPESRKRKPSEPSMQNLARFGSGNGNKPRRAKSKGKGGRKRSAAWCIIEREKKKDESISAQKLANIINRKCARQIAGGKLRKQTAATVRKTVLRMREVGALPRVPKPSRN